MNPFGGLLAAGAAAMWAVTGWIRNDDRSEFRKRITEKGITDPREVWDECIEYHSQLREELAEAKAKIQHAEELVRVAEGLHSLRKMMNDHEPPAEVKQSIISHWWTELMKLFVPWGLVIPEEIDPKQSKYFRLAGLIDPQRREAALRSFVFALQSSNKVLRQDLDNLLSAINEHGEIKRGIADFMEPKYVTVRVRPDLVQSAMDRYNEKTKVTEGQALEWVNSSIRKGPEGEDLDESEDGLDKFTEEQLHEFTEELINHSLEKSDNSNSDSADGESNE